MSDTPINVLTITSLYPNNNDIKHGIFVETRLRHLRQHYPNVNLTVIAPVPWFPSSNPKFGEYAKFHGVPDIEVINGVTVYHPKYLVVPKVGMYLTSKTMELSIRKCINKNLQKQSFDLIDGHYYFPDGVAIRSIAQHFKIPYTCTARGTDINLIPQYSKAKKMIHRVMLDANHNMAVCKALADEMVKIGCPKDKLTVLRNGVDLNIFKPSDNFLQNKLKTELGMESEQSLILSVGWLIERKGHNLIIEGLSSIPNAILMIAGSGPDLTKLKALAQSCGVAERVKFLGALTQPELNNYFKAADVSVLASSREGWANVLLEAMASGSPVVATKVWGTPEVVASDKVGILVERTAKDIAEGINHILSSNLDRNYIRQYAEQFDWQATSDGQIKIFESIIK